MKITAVEISSVFDQLLTGKKTREEVSAWAREIRQAEDQGHLEYEPPDRERDIWAAIQFLEGIDLRDSPDSYLHVAEDIIMKRKKTGI